MRINKYLATCGVASRRKVEELILSGKVKLNGQVVKNLATDVGDSDVVMVNNKPVTLTEKYSYIILNKPKNVLTSVSDDRGRKTVVDLIPKSYGRIFPVGRLDYNTEGLLILTNDGDFANLVIHPRNNVEKVYEVTTFDELTEESKLRLENGVEIDGFLTSKASIFNVQLKTKPYTFQIAIHEGKNRQVRKMCAAVGIHVQGLKRLKIGGLTLNNLPVGKFKTYEKQEIIKLIGVE